MENHTFPKRFQDRLRDILHKVVVDPAPWLNVLLSALRLLYEILKR
jgi:hypothetical protein